MGAELHEFIGQKLLEFCALFDYGSDARASRPIRERFRQGAVSVPRRSAAFLAPAETLQVLRDLVVACDTFLPEMKYAENHKAKPWLRLQPDPIKVTPILVCEPESSPVCLYKVLLPTIHLPTGAQLSKDLLLDLVEEMTDDLLT